MGSFNSIMLLAVPKAVSSLKKVSSITSAGLFLRIEHCWWDDMGYQRGNREVILNKIFYIVLNFKVYNIFLLFWF